MCRHQDSYLNLQSPWLNDKRAVGGLEVFLVFVVNILTAEMSKSPTLVGHYARYSVPIKKYLGQGQPVRGMLVFSGLGVVVSGPPSESTRAPRVLCSFQVALTIDAGNMPLGRQLPRSMGFLSHGRFVPGPCGCFRERCRTRKRRITVTVPRAVLSCPHDIIPRSSSESIEYA